MADFRFISHAKEVSDALQAAKDRALEIIGGKAESYAKRRCPTNTGRLKNSISHEQVDEDTEVIGTNVEYAPFIELGHRQQPGRYVPAIGKRLKKDHVDAKPFLRPAAEDHAQEYREIVKRELDRA